MSERVGAQVEREVMRRFCSVVLAGVLAACSGSPAGGEFVGSWVNVQRAKDTVVIDRDGSAFVFRETSPSIFDGKMHTDSYPATLKDGKLVVKVGGNAAEFAFDKASGSLVGSDGRKYAHQG